MRHGQTERRSKFITEVQLLEHNRHIGVPLCQLICGPYHYSSLLRAAVKTLYFGHCTPIIHYSVDGS